MRKVTLLTLALLSALAVSDQAYAAGACGQGRDRGNDGGGFFSDFHRNVRDLFNFSQGRALERGRGGGRGGRGTPNGGGPNLGGGGNN